MLASLLLGLTVATSQTQSAPLQRIAFGSCANQRLEQPVIWHSIVSADPDFFVFLGDNVYTDEMTEDEIMSGYRQQEKKPGFKELLNHCPYTATWDDHDYALNDGGEDNPWKDGARRAFLRFWDFPKEDEVAARDEGIYHAFVRGPVGQRVQFIVLDTRSFRSPLKQKPDGDDRPGRYVPDDDPTKTILGDEQWAWLERQLRVPAELRIVVSSIQVVPEDHLWEKWGNLPLEREKLFKTIADASAAGVVFISGDRHLAEISMMDGGVGYPLYDITASALTNSSTRWRLNEPNQHRVGTMNVGHNFGMITIDWSLADPLLRFQILDEQGEVTIQRKVPLSWLQPGKIRE